MSSSHKCGQESGYRAFNVVAATFPQIFWAFPPFFQIHRICPPLLSFLEGSSSCWNTKLSMLAMSERIFILGHSSAFFLPTGSYAEPLLFTGNLLGCFIVLRQAHGSTYYFGPLPPQKIFPIFLKEKMQQKLMEKP